MFVSKAWMYLLILTLVTCKEIQTQPEPNPLDDSRPDDAMTDMEKEQLLKMQNDLRRMAKAADMNKLKWSTTLESQAKILAESCSSEDSKEFKQLSNSEHIGTKYYMSPLHPSAWLAFNRWFDEMSLYYDPEHCAHKVLCQDAKKVLLSRSRFTGCAMKTCDPDFIKTDLVKGQLLVCVYAHEPVDTTDERNPRLVETSSPYLHGAPCSRCTKNYQICEDDLCDSGTVLGMAKGSDAARPNPAHPFAILIAMATGLAITTVGTRFVDF